MGKPQKKRHMAEVENREGTAKVRSSASSRSIEKGLDIEIVDGDSPQPILPRDAAGYVHDMAIELKGIAESARLSFLAYLLDLVIEESTVQKRGRV